MNRIYKVIWSKVKHQYVVVSELAHRDGKKSKGIGRSAAALLTVLALTAGIGVAPVWAEDETSVVVSSELTENSNTKTPTDDELSEITPFALDDTNIDDSASVTMGTDVSVTMRPRSTVNFDAEASLDLGYRSILDLGSQSEIVIGDGSKITLGESSGIHLGNKSQVNVPDEGRVDISIDTKDDTGSDRYINIGSGNTVSVSSVTSNNKNWGYGAIVIGLDNQLLYNAKNTVTIGNHTEVHQSTDSVVIGNNNVVWGNGRGNVSNVDYNVALGSGIIMGTGTSTGYTQYLQESTAVGGKIYMEEGDYNTALGYNSKIYDGDRNIALGTNVQIGTDDTQDLNGNVAIGDRATITVTPTSSGSNSGAAIALGESTLVTNKSYSGIAIGYAASVGSTGDAKGSMALGAGSRVDDATNSTAIGTDSRVSQSDILTNYSPRVEADWNATNDAKGVVSVGSTEKYTNNKGTSIQPFSRRIINVANGRIEAGSHDAVNGSQLRDYRISDEKDSDGSYKYISWSSSRGEGSPKDTLTLTWKDLYGIGEDYTTSIEGIASTEYVDEQMKMAGGSWNLTTSQDIDKTTNNPKSTTIGSNDIVDFAGTTKEVQNGDTTDEHQNIQVSQETQYEEDGKTVKGTNVRFDLNDDLYLGSGDNYINILGSQGIINVGTAAHEIHIDGSNGFITGLANIEWNPEFVGVSVDNGGYMGSSKAATESQLNGAFTYLNNKINNMEILPDDDNVHIEHPAYEKPDTGTGDEEGGNTGETGGVTGGGSTSGTGAGEGSDTPDNPNAHYVGLENDVTIGGRDDNENGVFDKEEEGSFAVVKGDGSEITINHDLDGDGAGDGVMHGLTNTEWDWNKYGKPVEEGGYAGSTNAATESQINDALKGTVQYDRDEDGNVDPTNITLNKGGDSVTIHNVAAGTADTDAVNVSQLNEAWDQINNNTTAITNIGNKVGELDSRIDEVGAGAAALAALHPLDFDPDDKWDFAAGYGNYRGENAVAIGAFYRPNEDTMFSVGGTVGNGDNMVNAGVSFKLGQGNGVSTSRVAMAKEIKDLRKELEAMKSAMLDVNAGRRLDTSKLQLFPDVPQNHWAYEYVATLAGNGVIEGYPDGNFDGARPMTRYEFAAMLYRAMLNGAKLSDKILTEFAPELERFTVDVVHKDKDGNPTVERVRVVKK